MQCGLVCFVGYSRSSPSWYARLAGWPRDGAGNSLSARIICVKPVIDAAEFCKRIEAMGWSITIDQKDGLWQARAKASKDNKSKGHKPVVRIGSSPEWALLALYNHILNRNMMRVHGAADRFGAWKTPWHNMSEQIAKAYRGAPAYETSAEHNWNELAKADQKQADAMRNQVRIEKTTDPDPYANAQEMRHDLQHNQHLFVSTYKHGNHPYHNAGQELNSDIAHLVLGHAHSGGDHTLLGRNLAVAHHMPMINEAAQHALFMDRIARPSYHHHYDGQGPHKITTLPEFVQPVAEEMGKHVWAPHGDMDVLHVSSLLEEFGMSPEPVRIPVTAFIPFSS